ncbi:MAG: pyridoxamine 5'-phosphate oxidase family protein [Acidimicrobiia bacterium]
MARKDISMTPAEIEAFLREPHILQVATLGPDGWPHLAAMWYVLVDGKVVFRSFSKSQKIVNLTRDPRLTVLIETGEAYAELRGVMIRGTAELTDDVDYVLEVYGRLAARYPMVRSEPVELSRQALEAAFGRYAAKNTAVAVVPERVTSWDHSKLGGAY